MWWPATTSAPTPAPSTSSSAGGPNGFPTTTVWAAAARTTCQAAAVFPAPVQRDLGLAKVEDAADLIPLGMPATPHTPRKDVWYMRRRYFHYPHFKYDVWAACENNKLLAYVVTRTVSAKETGCAPWCGSWTSSVRTVLPRLGALDAILNREGAEYMDCYNAGIPADVWLAAGLPSASRATAASFPTT